MSPFKQKGDTIQTERQNLLNEKAMPFRRKDKTF